MPLYFFHVRNGLDDFVDLEGTQLPDIPAASAYAQKLAHELMHRNEPKTRHWHVLVCDSDDNELLDLPFIAIDESIRHLNQKSRHLIEVMSEKRLALAQALFESRMTVLRTRATVARSRSRPYIAAEHGQAIFGAVKPKA